MQVIYWYDKKRQIFLYCLVLILFSCKAGVKDDIAVNKAYITSLIKEYDNSPPTLDSNVNRCEECIREFLQKQYRKLENEKK